MRRSMQVLLASLLALGATAPDAGAVTLIDWSSAGDYTPPQGASNQVLGYFATIGGNAPVDGMQHHDFAAGSDIAIKGKIANIVMGSNGTSKQVTLGDLAADGAIESFTDSNGNALDPNTVDNYLISTGYTSPTAHAALNLVVPGTEGSTEQIKVFDSADFQDGVAASLAGQTQTIFDHDSVYQYNGFGISNITADGGNATIDIGDDTATATAISDAANTLRLYTKNTALTMADGSGDATSQTHWDSDNYIQFGGAIQLPPQLSNGSATLLSYKGAVTLPVFGLDADGNVVQTGTKDFTVNSLRDIAAVNDWLLQSTDDTPSQIQLWLNGNATVNGTRILDTTAAKNAYQQIMNGLLAQKTTQTLNWTYDIWDNKGSYSGNLNLPTGPVNVIFATGKNALGEVTAAGSLAVSGSNVGVMHGEDNAQLVNNGAINTWNDTGAQAQGIYVTDAHATNNGTINAGLFIEKNGQRIVDNLPGIGGKATSLVNYGSVGIVGDNASTIANNGTINVALTDNGSSGIEGIRASGQSTVTNGGTINVVANPHLALGNATAYGASVSDGASIINQGTISLGVDLSGSSAADTAATMIGGNDLSAGIISRSSGDAVNQGTIVLGSHVRNAAAMLADGASGALTNSGTIDVTGTTVPGSSVMSQNFGLYVHDASNATNSGAINVSGAGNVGMKVYADQQNAYGNSTNTGTITLAGDGNPLYRNYALYVASQNYDHQAVADVNSRIILNEGNAIGVHVRNNALANLGSGANIVFNKANQIGFYAYGEQATIKSASNALNDNGQTGTTLFRIDHGAQFNGGTGNNDNYTLKVTGDNSVAVMVNGVSDLHPNVASTIDTGKAKISVAGIGSTGVKVTGGAAGTITDGVITLDNSQTTAVEVDGHDYSLDKPGTGTAVTKVTSTAHIDTGSTNVGATGYKVHDSGQLTLSADASLDITGQKNVGIDIGNNGLLDNLSTGAIRVGGNGRDSANVGVLVEGSNAQVTHLGNIMADGGLAAVKLTKGANLTVANANGNSAVTASNGADGILLDTVDPKKPTKDSLTAANLHIAVTGTGAGIQNLANSSDITLNKVIIDAGDGAAIRTAVALNAKGSSKNTLNVQGADTSRSGAGFAFEDSDTSKTLSGDLNIGTNYEVNVHNANNNATGNGVRARTTGKVTSGTTINVVDATGGSALLADSASSVTQSGNITSHSATTAAISAVNATSFTNSGTVTANNSVDNAALVALTGGAKNSTKTILNTGKLQTASASAVAIDANNQANNNLTNSGAVLADKNGTAIQTGSGNDTITLKSATVNGKDTGMITGNINTGSGSDKFDWEAGTLAGNVDFTGSEGDDSASVGEVALGTVGHILTGSSSGNTLTLNNTHTNALIGSFDSDDQTRGTNIGSGWNNITVTGSKADVRVVDKLAGVTGQLTVTNGATLRTGALATDATQTSIGNHNVVTGNDATVVMDGTGNETYSGVVSGSGQLTRASGGKTLLTADNTYTGKTTIQSGGLLQLGNGGATGGLSPQSAILDDGELDVNLSREQTFNGKITGQGTLHQDGTGLTRLNGDNEYLGVTEVNHGTLIVNGVQTKATGDTTVESGATLGGHGTIGGNVVIKDGATLKPGDNGAGTLTIGSASHLGSLTLAAGSTSDFELGKAYMPGGALNDLVTVTGDLTLGGTLNVSQSAGGNFNAGVYRIFNYGGALNNAQGMTLGSLPSGYTGAQFYLQTNVAGQVNLVNNAGLNLQFWDGQQVGTSHGATGIEGDGKIEGGNGNWTVQGGAGDNNWTHASGDDNAPWTQNAYAVFEGTGGVVTVSNGPGDVMFAGGQFASDGYVVGGDALHIADTLSATHTVDGVALPNGTAAGDFDINVGDGSADDASLTATLNNDLVQQNASDSLVLVKQGNGRLILGGNNQYAGGTRIDGGTLQVHGDVNLGVTGTQIAINNNSILQNGADWQTARTLVLGSDGGQLDLNSHSLDHQGKVTGAGALTVRSSSADAASALTLEGNNDYQGNTTISGTDHKAALTVNAQNANALGNTASLLALSHGATLNINNASSLMTHHVTSDDSLLALNGSATAADATIDLLAKGQAALNDSANGGNATVNVASTAALSLNGDADGGSMRVNNLGQVNFSGNAQAAGATVGNAAGAIVDIAAATDHSAIGSLSGAGNVQLGDRELREGALNRDDTIGGVISGGKGALTKQGSGTLTLTGNNSYGGATQVQQGVLLVNGNQQAATGNVTVASGTTLGGNGTLGGAVDVADNAHIAAGAAIGQVGTLTTGALSFHQDSQLDYQLGQAYVPGGALNDLVNVNGDLNLDGKLNITQSPGGSFGLGVYRLINYTGKLAQDNTLDIASGPVAASLLSVQTSLDHQVNLVYSQGVNLQFWDGQQVGTSHGASGIEGDGKIEGGDGRWMSQGGTGDNNWTTASGTGNAPWAQNAFAIFEGTGGNVTVDKAKGDVGFGGAQFASDGYVVSGDALHAVDTASAASAGSSVLPASGPNKGDLIVSVGSGTAADASMTATVNSAIVQQNGADSLTLVKQNGGRLILGGNNQYAGGTRIDGGTLQVHGDTNLGVTGTQIAINNNSTLQNGADWQTARTIVLGAAGGQLDLNSHSLNHQGKITGTGPLTVRSASADAASTLTLAGPNDYQGDTTIVGTDHQAALTVNAETPSSLGNIASLVALSHGATLNINNGGSLMNHHVTSDDSLVAVNGSASAGNATIDLLNNGQAALNGSASGGKAQVNVSTSGTLGLNGNADGGRMQVNNLGHVNFSANAQGAGVAIANAAGAIVDIAAATDHSAIGSLSGAGNAELGDRELREGALNRDDTISGVISGGKGALTKQGSGTLTLTGDNSYGGATQVQQGVLLVNGNQQAASGNVTVASGTTLGGNGTLGGAVDVADNAHIAAGAAIGKVGLLTTGALSLHQDSQLDYQLGQAYVPGGALNDLVNVNGDLNLDGKLNITQSPGGNFGLGVYRLINYTGKLAQDNTLDIASGPVAASLLSVQTSIDHEVNLVYGHGLNLQFWDGQQVGTSHGASGIEGDGKIEGGDGRWLSQGGTGDNNWTTASGSGNAPWAQNAYAIFESQGGNVTVDKAKGDVNFAGAQFASNGYVISGDALHAVDTASAASAGASALPASGLNKGDLIVSVGSGSAADAGITATVNSAIVQQNSADGLTLVKQNGGRLILNGDNQYAGGTRIDGGTLQVHGDVNLGVTGTQIAINNNSTLQNGADWQTARTLVLGSDGGQLDLNSHGLNHQGNMTGDGALTVRSSSASGASELTLAGNNDYRGDTTISGTDHKAALTVNAENTSALGNTASLLALSHGATLNVNNASSLMTHHVTSDDSLLALNGSATAADATIDLLAKGQAALNDSANGGNATVNVASTAALSLNGNADGGSMRVNNLGQVNFSGNAQAAGATIGNAAGAIVDIAAAIDHSAIGSLSGAGNVQLGDRELREGALNRDDTISGVISGGKGALTKQGSGTLTLTGDNSYGGATQVQQGVLLVNGNQQAATGNVTVASGATLGGNGTLGGAVDVADNAHIAAGAAIGQIGVLTTGALSFHQDSQLDYQLGQAYHVGGAYNDLVNVNGDLNLDGKLNITQSPGGRFDAGVYRLINYTGKLASNNILDIASAPAAADRLYVQTSIDHQVNLVNRDGLVLRFWDGAGGTGGALKDNGVIDGGNGLWQNSLGNDNWTTDTTDPQGIVNAPFDNDSFAVFEGQKGTVTVDKSLGDVYIHGAQFVTDGYVVQGDALNTHTQDTVIRVGDGTAAGAATTATINSVIQGSGGIDKTDAGTLVLNGANRYQGGTTVHGGTLSVAADDNLGAAGTELTLDGGVLRYGKGFDTARQVTLGQAGGSIDTFGHDSALLTALRGSGRLIKLGAGTLTLTADSQATGGTTLSGGTLQMGNGGTAGALQGNVIDNATLVANRSNTLTLSGDISGSGSLVQQGSGTTILSGHNDYQGPTAINNGTLAAGHSNALSASSVHGVAAGATLDTAGFNQQIAGLVNQGRVTLRGTDIGSALTVKGNYVGDNGVIAIAAGQPHGTQLADKLVVDGGNASGHTRLDIDISRLGAPTHGDGIEVVEAKNGATTTVHTSRDAFSLGRDHLEAGAFSYRLFAGDSQSQGENWYLRSDYRPEAPSFDGLIQTARQADMAVLGNLHLRMGDDNQPHQPGQDREPRAWARYINNNGSTRLNDAPGTALDTHITGVQVGTDLWTNDKWQTGVYASVTDSHAAISGQANGRRGYVGNIDDHATHVGGYATWTDDNGWYVDNVVQYGWHDMRVKTGGHQYHPNGTSLLASVETGRPYQLGHSHWQVEPQAQLYWQHSSFDNIDVKGDSATVARMNAGDAVTARIGARLVGHYSPRIGEVKPYLRVNLWQGLSGNDSTHFTNSTASTSLTAGQRYSSTEVAAGMTWSVKPNVQLYGEVGHQWSNKGGDTEMRSNLSGSAGIKVDF